MGMFFDEFEVGKKYISANRTVREADIQQFAGLSADYNPLHTDETYIRDNTQYKRCIAHGALTFAMSTGFVFQDGLTAGTSLGFLGTEIKWPHPVYPGDTIHLETTILEKRESKKPTRGVIIMSRNVVNQDGDVCMESTATVMVRRKQPDSAGG